MLIKEMEAERQFFKTRKAIENWLEQNNIWRYDINDDMSVNIKGDLNMMAYMNEYLPFQFRKVEGSFTISGSPHLVNLKGSPDFVGKSFSAINCPNLRTPDFAPMHCGLDFRIHGSVKTFHNINSYVKHIGRVLTASNDTTNLLGILFIEGIRHINIDDGGPIDSILNKYMKMPYKDLHKCQEEMLDAGLSAQART